MASPRATLAPTPQVSLGPTAPDAVRLVGTLRIDADYVVRQHAGRLVSDAGGVLLVGDALLSNNGGGLIGDHGSGVVSNNSGTLVSNNGGTLISNNGGAAVTHAFGLLADIGASAEAAATGAASPAEQGLTPVAGMSVGLRSLADGRAIAVAKDATGQDVFSVPSDARGNYTVYAPASLAGNVLVTAEVPGTQDQRLQYELVTPVHVSARAAAIDEDTALATRYLRESYVADLEHIIADDPNVAIDIITVSWTEVPGAVRAAILQLVTDLHAAAVTSGLATAPHADVQRVAQAITDIALARLDLASLRVDESQSTWYTGPQELVIPGVVDIMRQIRVAAAAKLAADPSFFDHQAYIDAADQALGKHFQILKPADLGQFIVEAYMSQLDPDDFLKAGQVLASVGLTKDATTGQRPSDRMLALSDQVIISVAQLLLADQDGARTQAIALASGYKASVSAAASGAARPATAAASATP